MPTYPMINLVVKHQKTLAVGAAVVLILLFLVPAVLLQAPLLGVCGVILGSVVWFLLRLLGEVVQVIAETLLPR
jgi:hypothetical protein